AYFEKVLTDGIVPSEEEIEKFRISIANAVDGSPIDSIPLNNLLRYIQFCTTAWDARNAVNGGSVKVGWEVIKDDRFEVKIPKNGVIIQMGKKKFRNVFLKEAV
ncbi:MAG: hypothetical protein ACD_71C00196G0001, partial [uncultured bacterium (gcode 4)]